MNDQITLSFSVQEINALVALLDQGVRQAGIRSAKDAAVLIERIERAVATHDREKDNTSNVIDLPAKEA